MADESTYQPRFTVSSLTVEISTALESRFRRIFVDGEISGWKVSSLGHAYFTLKDQGAVIGAVMFRSAIERCRVRDGLKDGAKVLVCGKVSVYGPHGKYQIIVSAAKLEGEGDLMQRYLELKSKLEREGLFDASRKRKLPFLPRRIGIVTSETGAVIHDMCTVLTRRFHDLEITLYPSLVQGVDAPASLIAGIEYFNCVKPDLLIVARGGGSFEDLFCFNDERLVRAVASAQVPVISAVGHETDFTLCDFAADVRAGTPSIAAEIAVPVKQDLVRRIDDLRKRMAGSLQSKGEWYAQHLDRISDSLVSLLQKRHLVAVSRLEGVRGRLLPAVNAAYSCSKANLERTSAKLSMLSPFGVLDRGYALVTDAKGAVVRDGASVRSGERLDVRVAKGTFAVNAL